MPQIALGVNAIIGEHAKIEDEQRHGDGKDAIAERDTSNALSGNRVVEGLHRKKSSQRRTAKNRER